MLTDRLLGLYKTINKISGGPSMSEDLFLSDAHTHLDQYGPDEIEGIVERAVNTNVLFIVCAGTTLASTPACIKLTNEYPIF